MWENNALRLKFKHLHHFGTAKLATSCLISAADFAHAEILHQGYGK